MSDPARSNTTEEDGLEIQIVLPAVSDEPLADMLRELTQAIVERDPEKQVHGFLGGEFGYGADFENDTFSMHHYCWCDNPECPWCGGCYCASNTMRGCDRPAPEGVKCDWCAGVHRWADKGAIRPDDPPHYGAPHFWHKRTGLRVWWYKYIGRDMQVVNMQPDLSPIMAECLASLKV